jgi:hypothetical protein
VQGLGDLLPVHLVKRVAHDPGAVKRTASTGTTTTATAMRVDSPTYLRQCAEVAILDFVGPLISSFSFLDFVEGFSTAIRSRARPKGDQIAHYVPQENPACLDCQRKGTPTQPPLGLQVPPL